MYIIKGLDSWMDNPINPSIPEFLDSSIREFGRVHFMYIGVQSKIKSRMANSVDPDATARYLNWSAGM